MALMVGGADRVGPLLLPWRWSDEAKRRALRGAVAERMPKDWQGAIHARARAVRSLCDEHGRRVGIAAECAVLAHWIDDYGGANGADLTEDGVRSRAERIAATARVFAFLQALDAAATPASAWVAWECLAGFIARHGPPIAPGRQRMAFGKWLDWARGVARRAVCPRWWRSRVRRWVAQQYERGAIELGKVGAQAGAWYCSDATVRRRIQQVRASESMMRRTIIESATGQTMTLADVSKSSVSNKAIRRGELMTRIRGCEEWADAAGLVGLFTTNTCPSRFHAHLRSGGVNPKHRGETPADAQAWLNNQWKRLRAKWHRRGIRVVGYRVAEPHHDGCPHWHMLIWCKPHDVDAVRDTMRAQWLSEDGTEAGADRYRVNIKTMLNGQAAGYIAKYISKNIDDHAITSHHDDDDAPGQEVGPDLLDDLEVKPSMRVEAWAATWRIRQFQAIGQPPVTVWRELRRVTEEAAAGGSHDLVSAWIAAHRKGDRLADWHRYMRAQGGAGLARKDYRLCVHSVERERVGRYEAVRERWACGVVDRARSVLPVTPTRRVEWGAEGFASRRAAAPWTRFNNCTVTGRHNRCDIAPTIGSARDTRAALGLAADYGEAAPAVVDRLPKKFLILSKGRAKSAPVDSKELSTQPQIKGKNMDRTTLAQFASANAGNYQTTFELKAVKSGSDIAFRASGSFNNKNWDICDDSGKVKTFRNADDFIKQACAVGMLATGLFGGISFSGLELVQPKEFTGDIIKKNQALMAGYQKRVTACKERLATYNRELSLMAADPTVPQRLKDEKVAQRVGVYNLEQWLESEIDRITSVLSH